MEGDGSSRRPPGAPGPAPAGSSGSDTGRGSHDHRPPGERRTGAPPAAGSRLPAVLAVLAIVAVVIAVGSRRLAGTGGSCGDRQVHGAEECDDGNAVSTDSCLPSCKLATCGDGMLRAHVEECDDGNRADGDGCSRACLSCPSGNDSFASSRTGHCYWRSNETLSFKEAARSCASRGGHLASFSDDDEWREVNERLLAGGNTAPVWIGLVREDRNGLEDFGWVSGERVLSARWGIQEPRLNPSNLDCGVQGEAGAWAAVACDERRGFVCERAGWEVWPRNGHAYRRFIERVTFPEAQASCSNRGGHLATLTDASEQDFVGARFPGAVWIGAGHDEKTGGFRWLTGEPFTYQDFAPGEPNVRHHRCLALEVDRRWYDRACNDRHGFVCEID